MDRAAGHASISRYCLLRYLGEVSAMSHRAGMRVEQALGRLGPQAILGSAFLLGGLLGAAPDRMIPQPAPGARADTQRA